ncbi:MAG: signal peptidase II [Anaerolineales bacterium]
MLVLAFGTLIIFVDQLSKWAVTTSRAGPNPLSRQAVLQIRLISKLGNKQSRFSHSIVLLLLFAIITLSLVLLIQFGLAFQNLYAQIALGGALGGAASNLLDRFWRGAIVDFIDVGFWPVFNLADVAICVGALVALLNSR